MIRSLQSSDLPDILALLHWMDDSPEREVFTPLARDLRDLRLEIEDNTCYVHDDQRAEGVQGYCAVTPFYGGLLIEGPLSETGEQLRELVSRAVTHADGLPVYAFCARDNTDVRGALEAAGLFPMHTTDFYSAPAPQLARPGPPPRGYELVTGLSVAEYRSLYRAAEDTWATRLEWSPEQYDAHFARDDVKLLALTRRGRPVAFAELEFDPAEGSAELTHLAVHPAERGQHLGRALLALAATEAARTPAIRTLRARAHDHMRAARAVHPRGDAALPQRGDLSARRGRRSLNNSKSLSQPRKRGGGASVLQRPVQAGAPRPAACL